MLVTKLVTATSACITHWLAPGTSFATPTAPMRFGVWSSEIGIQSGAALVGNDSLPARAVPVAGFSPADTFGVQSVAVCSEPFGSDVGTPCDDGAAEGPEGWAWVDLFELPRANTRITTSAITPNTAIPARMTHGIFERGPFGGGPGG